MASTQTPPETGAANNIGAHPFFFSNGGGGLSTDELVVVMPTRIRMDSRVVLTHCTITWLSNSVFVLLLLAKVHLCKDMSVGSMLDVGIRPGSIPGGCSGFLNVLLG